MNNHSLFDYIARDDDAPRVAGRKALALASKRIEDRFGNFLSRTAGNDTAQRLELVRDDFDAVVAAACEEVGYADADSLTRTLWNDRISRISGDNPFAKKDEDDEDEDEDGEKKGDKKSRTASTHEARKPKLCPYHDEVMSISLAQGEPQAGYNAMASHAWSDKHCKGDGYEGSRCNFKPEMTTQSYWDTKAEKAEQRRQERQEQQVEVPQAEPVAVSDEAVGTLEDGFEVEQIDAPEGGEAEVDAGLPAEELMAVAASTKRFVPLVHDAGLFDKLIPGAVNALGDAGAEVGNALTNAIPGGQLVKSIPAALGVGGQSTPAPNAKDIHHQFSEVAGNGQPVYNPGAHSQQNYQQVADQMGISADQVQKGLTQFYDNNGTAQRTQFKNPGVAGPVAPDPAALADPDAAQGIVRRTNTAAQKKHLEGDKVTDKRQRQYEHIKKSCLEDGKSEEECKELAARTVNKQRAEKGETETKSHVAAEGLGCARCGDQSAHPGAPCPTCGYLYNERTAEALEHQDVTKNTFPKMDRSNERPKDPPDTEMAGSPHPTKREDIQPDITVPRQKPQNNDPEDIGEDVTERQDVTQESGFSNKYPNRWASADAAIANFNRS